MPLETPFHARTAALCTSLAWKEWAGYHAVRHYGSYAEREYFAFRHAAGLLDVTPLYKFDVRGADAARFLSYVTVKDVTRLAPGRVTYLCWCDARGRVLDDGTLTCWDDRHFRMTAADPTLAWLEKHARGFDVSITDVSLDVAAVAIQGPRSKDVLLDAGADVEGLPFFRAVRTTIGRVPVEVSRTGYTGDLGYEVWTAAEHAVPLWDALIDAGRRHGLLPAGLDALDVTRVEAGFLLGGVDYTSARRALIPDQYSTPDELGLGWCVDLEREPFLGQDAIRAERAHGNALAFAGLVIDWDELEQLYASFDLPPDLPAGAWRASIPVHHGAVQVGYATSGTWSPTLKQNLALATLQAAHAKLGTELSIEWTVEHQRRTVKATVAKKPFFDPSRKRSVDGR
jgi:aminomethyltransferase